MFFFYAEEGTEPPHVHVDKGDGSAKLWLQPLARPMRYEFHPEALEDYDAAGHYYVGNDSYNAQVLSYFSERIRSRLTHQEDGIVPRVSPPDARRGSTAWN